MKNFYIINIKLIKKFFFEMKLYKIKIKTCNKKIDGTKTAKEIANRDENVKELLINLKKDNLLFVDE